MRSKEHGVKGVIVLYAIMAVSPAPGFSQTPEGTASAPAFQPAPAPAPRHYGEKGFLDLFLDVGYMGNFGTFSHHSLSLSPVIGIFPANQFRIGFRPTFFYENSDPPDMGNQVITWGLKMGLDLQGVFYTRSIVYPFVGGGVEEGIEHLHVNGCYLESDDLFVVTSITLVTGISFVLNRAIISLGFRYLLSFLENVHAEAVTFDIRHRVLFTLGIGFWILKNK